jgi:uncharacterized membrane protein
MLQLYGKHAPSFWLAIVAAACLAAAPALADPQPGFIGLPVPPAPFESFRAYGASADASIVLGRGRTTSGLSAPMIWSAASGYQALAAPQGSQYTSANAISPSGVIVGGWSNRAFTWTATTGMQFLADQPGAVDIADARRISSDNSTITGRTTPATGGSEATQWTSSGSPLGLGTLTPAAPSRQSYALDATPDAHTVVGWSGNSAGNYEAMRWTAETGMVALGDLPGGAFSSIASGVSSNGAIVVGSGLSAQGYEGFRWSAETGMIGLGDLPGGSFYSYAYAVSANGQTIVGQATSERGALAAYWPLNGPAHDLQADLESFGVSAVNLWSLQDAYVVTPDGNTIVGNGVDPLGYSRAWVATIPSPGAATLVPITYFAIRRGRRLT